MRRHILPTSLALIASVGPLATAGHAADGLTVNSARFVSGSQVTVTSSVSCPAGYDYFIDLTVRQVRGLHQAVAGGFSEGTCTGTAQTVTTQVDNFGHIAFRRGKAEVTAHGSAFVCSEDGEFCDDVLLADGARTRLRLR